jgi:uncharacterized protein YceH (UPF0502 family)
MEGWSAPAETQPLAATSIEDEQRIARLETEVHSLRQEVADLRQQLVDFRKQFE